MTILVNYIESFFGFEQAGSCGRETPMRQTTDGSRRAGQKERGERERLKKEMTRKGERERLNKKVPKGVQMKQ